MNQHALAFNLSNAVRALGLNGAYFIMSGLHNKDLDPEFEKIKDRVIKEILADLSPEKIKSDPVLCGFRQLHEAVQCSNRKNVASPENLLNMLLKTGNFPHVNLIVDIYNLVSIETRLALGAHDIDKVTGTIHLRMTDGTENFWPLGSQEPKTVRPNQYAYIDDANDVICLLEVRQVEKTKVTLATTECFYIVQGNMATDEKYLKAATEKLINLTKKFCGGQERMLYTPW